MRKILLRPEIFVYVSIVVFTAAFFALNAQTNHIRDGALGAYYVQLNGDKIAWAAVFVFLVLFVRISVWWAVLGFRGTDLGTLVSRQKVSATMSALRTFFKNSLLVGLPALLAFYSFTLALGQLNVFNKDRLQDELLARWDVLVTGTFPPLSLASLHYPAWFVEAVSISFLFLGTVLAFLAAYLFQARQKVFDEAIGAFFAGSLILFAGWIFFPVLSPQDRFIDNEYNLPVPASVQEYVDAYRPQEEIATFLKDVRERKRDLTVLPTSTFPSAHVFWSALVSYYAWRAHKWLILFAFPFAVLSSLGTVFFAQHYFVDIPAGILVGVVSVWLARRLANSSKDFSVRPQHS